MMHTLSLVHMSSSAVDLLVVLTESPCASGE